MTTASEAHSLWALDRHGGHEKLDLKVVPRGNHIAAHTLGDLDEPQLVMAVSLFVAVPMIAYAAAKTPTIADAQKLVQTISSDKTKLKAYAAIR